MTRAADVTDEKPDDDEDRLWASQADVDLLARALALQGAFVAILQRVLIRVVARLAVQDRELLLKVTQDGARELEAQSKRLAGAGYRDVLQDLLHRFDVMREELKEQPDEKSGRTGQARPQGADHSVGEEPPGSVSES